MDYAALFDALPTPYLAMTPDLVIVEANRAYLAVVGRRREELVGRWAFDAFPPTPVALDETGVSRIQRSFERARDTGQLDTMPLQKYDIADAEGNLVERYWSLISVPVLAADGSTSLVLQRTEDVTDYVRERSRGHHEAEKGEAWRRKAEEVEADLFARGEELRAALFAAEQAGLRLAALAEVAMQLTSAQTLEQLTTVIVERGLAALGADGGAVGVRGAGGVLHLTITASLGAQTQVDFAELRLDGPLPASVVAATGQRVLLPDRATALAWSPAMADVLSSTGCDAWASLPLRSGDRLLGSLSVGWRGTHDFPSAERELLDALAAQCAQGLDRIQVRSAERQAAAAAQRMSETLQRSLLTEPTQPAGLQIAVRYRPAAREAQVGGDWYDAFANADGITSVVIGDVAGHDRDAAAAMGQFRNLLRGIAYTVGDPPADVLRALDCALRDLAVGSLATAVLARVEPLASGSGFLLQWSNAGHPPPLLVDASGQVRLLTTDADLLLGLDPDTDRTDHEHELAPGSTVLLYTDGLVERRTASLDHGLARLVEVAQGLPADDLEAFCDHVLEQVGRSEDDDTALLALRVQPGPASQQPQPR